jgi:hypothetical protein
MDQYEKLEKIGEGTYGKVGLDSLLPLCPVSGNWKALKTLLDINA